MSDTRTLHVLGCVPSLLENLFELAHAAIGTDRFVLLKNVPVDVSSEYRPSAKWDVTETDCFDVMPDLPIDALFALSVVGTESKPAVFDFFESAAGAALDAFPPLVHPTAYVSPSSVLGAGLQLEQLSTIAAATRVGFGVNIKRGSNIGHHCTLDDFVTINPGVSMSGHVQVGSRTMIGTGAAIRDHVRIGENCLIGVGSAVVEDIPDNSIAFGNPCRVRGTRGD